MLTIGILGGVAGGKSHVAQILAEFGAAVLDADAAGRRVLAEPAIVDLLVQQFGREVLEANGAIDRQSIAKLVFGEGDIAAENRAIENRRKLEAILHPAIRADLEAEARMLVKSQAPVAMVLDAPLLLEAGWETMCDLLVFIDTPSEKRLQFARQRGWSDDQLELRQRAQMDLAQKRDRADFILANRGGQAELRQTVRRFWDTHVITKISGA